MQYKVTAIIEHDADGYYAYCPELKGCQSEGQSLDDALGNIREAIQLYVEDLSEDERATLLTKEIISTAIEVNVA